MTKTALIIIALLLIIPVIIGLHYYRQWKENNAVVASYGDTVDEVLYGNMKLKKIAGSEDYLFAIGKYLGKIDDVLFGSQLYSLDGDGSGDYYAVAGNDGLVLMSVSGTMTDGIRGKNSRVTKIVFADYQAVTDDAYDIDLITSVSGEKEYDVVPSEFGNGGLTAYTVHLFFDGSAVSTEESGRFYYFSEKNRWVFVTRAKLDEGDFRVESGEDEEVSYTGTEVENPALLRVLRRVVLVVLKEENAASTSENVTD